MTKAGIELLLVHYTPNICYLTGFKAVFSSWYNCLIVPIEGPMTLQVCEYDQALLSTEIESIEYVRWDQTAEMAPPRLLDLIKRYGPRPKRVGLDLRLNGLQPSLVDFLRDALADSDFVDASDLVLRMRSVKSAAEIACMRHAANASVAGFEAAAAAVHRGCTENDVASAALGAMVAAGSEYPSTGPFIRAGARSSVMHATWRRQVIEPGDSIILEIGAVYERYSAPVYGTAVIGDPSDGLRRFFEICRTAVDLVHENIRPGRTAADVARSASRELRTLSSDIELVERYGYSVGLSFPPDWVEHSFVIAEEYEQVLEPGMTLHTPRSLRVRGVMSAGYSDTVVVTESGCEVLTPHTRELVCVA